MTTSPELPSPIIESPIGLLATLSSVTALLAACGGGASSNSASGSSGLGGIGSSGSGAALIQAQAARFLLQAQFSASDSDIAAVQSQGYTAWLAAQITAPISTTGWDWQMAQGYNTAASVNSITPADYMMWQQLISSTDAVRKRVALALSEFFVVSSNGVSVSSSSFAMAQYWDVLVAGAFGNFRTLLEDITLNPAMGVYLNTKGNQKANAATGRLPDENYAREVLQLFSIGLYELNLDGTNRLSGGLPIETYTQSDITNLAKVLTGWDFDAAGSTAVTNPLNLRNRMKLTASLHESASASFLGATVPANTSGAAALGIALDAIFNHANVPPFFCKQLIQRLVTSNPSAAYVSRVASIFKNNGSGVRGDLKAVVAAVLLDAEARDESKLTDTSWGKQREPMLRLVQWARTFDATSTTGQWLIGDLSDMGTRLGQSPLRSGSVFNFFRPGYVPPNTALALQSLTAPEFQLTNESTTAGYLNYMMTTIKSGYNGTTGGLAAPGYAAELALVNDPAGLMSRLNLLLCAGQLSSATLGTIQTAITTISISTPANQLNRVCAAIFLVMASPEYLIQK
jgi:uncharacterized protein (DUF1800 family)